MTSPRPPASLLVQADHPEGTTASYPALAIEQNDQKFYFATIPKEDIFPYCYVADRKEDPAKGFQRLLDAGRAKDIANYLDESRGSIPTNIVLSAQTEALLRYDSKTKTIKYKRLPQSFLVIDGQHRLYGYGFTKKKHRVPVAIYVGLSRKVEVSLFIDINTTQRGVPAALLLDIKNLAERESELESNLRELFDFLGAAPDSPLNGLTSSAHSVRGKIARPTFNKAVSPIFGNAVIERLQKEKQFELFKNFLRAIENNLSDPHLLVVAAYFEAVVGLFDDVLHLSRQSYGNYKYDSLNKVLAPIKNLDLTKIMTGGKTRLNKANIVPVLKELITGQIDVSDNMV